MLSIDDLVFTSITLDPLGASVLTHDFQRVTKRASISGVRFHDLRHTFASLMLLRGAKGITVRHNISADNYCGIILNTTSDTLIEENEIARNNMDGLIISYNSANVKVQRNYIHHHLLWGHPDNIQLYNDVKNIQFIDNLLIAGGQSMMMAGTTDTLLKGNIR